MEFPGVVILARVPIVALTNWLRQRERRDAQPQTRALAMALASS